MMNRSGAVKLLTAMRSAKEAEPILNFLASCPNGVSSADRPMVLDTNGQMTADGALWEIVAKPIGGGIYRLTLKPWRLNRGA